MLRMSQRGPHRSRTSILTIINAFWSRKKRHKSRLEKNHEPPSKKLNKFAHVWRNPQMKKFPIHLHIYKKYLYRGGGRALGWNVIVSLIE